MKVRTGFVSNSSSSSFVIGFPHKPKSAEDVQEMMFGKQQWHYSGIYGATNDVSTLWIAEKVFSKIEKEAEEAEVLKAIGDGWFEGYMGITPGYYDNFKEYNKLDREDPKFDEKFNLLQKESEKINDERAKMIVKLFYSIAKEELYFAVMWFSDNEGEEVLEHSDIFQRLPHIRTSYH